MAVYLRPYEGEPLPDAAELYRCANILSYHDAPLSLIRAINSEGLVRDGAQTRKGRTAVRIILGFFDFQSWMEYETPLSRLPLWRLTNSAQRLRDLIKRKGW